MGCWNLSVCALWSNLTIPPSTLPAPVLTTPQSYCFLPPHMRKNMLHLSYLIWHNILQFCTFAINKRMLFFIVANNILLYIHMFFLCLSINGIYILSLPIHWWHLYSFFTRPLIASIFFLCPSIDGIYILDDTYIFSSPVHQWHLYSFFICPLMASRLILDLRHCKQSKSEDKCAIP